MQKTDRGRYNRHVMRRRQQKIRLLLIGLPLLLLIGGGTFIYAGRPIWNPIYLATIGERGIDEAVATYAPQAQARLKPRFAQADMTYPPQSIAFIGLKSEKTLELWAKDTGDWQLIHTYPILAASGGPGPKLREGDRQVPEGIYRIDSLNPNSSYHLSMKLNYPNAFDRTMAQRDGRNKPGTNIFIHGKAASAGCLAMGDPAIEELFVLIHQVGLDNVEVIITPRDPRQSPLQAGTELPTWADELYTELNQSVSRFQYPPPADSDP